MKDGDVVVLVGRRRRGTYARISAVKKQKKSACVVPQNVASNLRLRQDDAVKIVPLHSVDHEEARSGDLVLMQSATVPKVESATFAPVQDSLDNLQGSEGGDEIPDEELMERFVKPYTEAAGGLLKTNMVLTLVDENGKKLDFIVTQIDLAGDASKKDEAEEEEDGTYLMHRTEFYPARRPATSSYLFYLILCERPK